MLAGMNASSTPPANTGRWDLLWAVRRSQRYHARRHAFYRRWHQLTAFVGVIGGSAVFASLGHLLPTSMALWAAAAVALLSAADLVVGTADMAHVHHDLRRQFGGLEADIIGDIAPSAAILAAWEARRLAIEAHEPPVYVALDILCENELIRATGQHLRSTPPHPLPWFKRATAHVFLWENA